LRDFFIVPAAPGFVNAGQDGCFLAPRASGEIKVEAVNPSLLYEFREYEGLEI